jgi:hypothetical protein
VKAQPPWQIEADEVIDPGLSAEERELLWHGLLHWGGPARPTDALARVIGFSSVDRLFAESKPLMESLKGGRPLRKRDWERVLVATEIGFSSSYYGAAGDWEIVTGWDDERTLRVLRGIQRKLAGFRAPPHRTFARKSHSSGE